VGLISCPICKSDKACETFKDEKSGIDVNVCENCYMIYQQKDPKVKYYEIQCRIQEDFDRHARAVADYTLEFANPPKDINSVLEIGAHSHLTLSYMKEYFHNDVKLCGLDLPKIPGSSHSQIISGIEMIYNNCIDTGHSSDVKDALKSTSFDFIFCRHTLEHFQNPVRAVWNVRNILSNDGIAFFEVPSFFWTEVNGVHTYHPEHLLYFTKSTISRLFSDAGFKILKIKESKYWGNIKILVKKSKSNEITIHHKPKNDMKLKRYYNFIQPLFIFIKRNKKINPNQ